MDWRPTFSVATLGCKVNQYDSWQLIRELKAMGFHQLPFGMPSDVVIVNSCTVTHVAESKSRKMLSRARRLSPNGIVVFTGCTAEMLKQNGIQEVENANIICGNDEKSNLAEQIATLLLNRQHLLTHQNNKDSPYSEPLLDIGEDGAHERARAFLKVQDGCDKFCTFCVIPFTRGSPRSKPLRQVLDEATELVNEFGFCEIVLTGVCLTLWGKEFGMNLSDLITCLHELDGLKRIRLSSLDPRDLDETFIRVCYQLPKVCHHFHISLQSGDDEILQAMGRGYNHRQFAQIVETFRTHMPDSAFTTDVMVGFPGETEKQFENTLQFVQEIGFMLLHVFQYSPRPFTEAAKLLDANSQSVHKVKPDVAEERSHRLITIGKQLWQQFANRFIKRKREVMVERCCPIEENGLTEGFQLSGLTDNYLRVHWQSDRPIPIGALETVWLERLETQQKLIWGKLTG